MTTNLPSALDQLLNKQVQGNGVQAITRPAANFIGSGVSVVDNPGNNSTDITINSGGAFGKVNLTLANGTNSNKATDGSLLQIIGGPTAAFALGSVLPSVSLLSGQPVVFAYAGTQTWTIVHQDPAATGSSLKFSIPGFTFAGAALRVFGKLSVHYDGTSLIPDLGATFNPWIDVRQYGAVGNGSHDDTAAIQAAINAATTGSTIFFPGFGAVYRITSPLLVAASAVRFRGESSGSIGGATLSFQFPAVATGVHGTITSVATNTPTTETAINATFTLGTIATGAAANIVPGDTIVVGNGNSVQNNGPYTVITGGTTTCTYYGQNPNYNASALYKPDTTDSHNGSLTWAVYHPAIKCYGTQATIFENLTFDGTNTVGAVFDVTFAGTSNVSTGLTVSNMQWHNCFIQRGVYGVKIGDFSGWVSPATTISWPDNCDQFVFRDTFLVDNTFAGVLQPNSFGQGKYHHFLKCTFESATQPQPWGINFRSGSFTEDTCVFEESSVCDRFVQSAWDTITIRGSSSENAPRTLIVGIGYFTGPYPVSMIGCRGDTLATVLAGDGHYIKLSYPGGLSLKNCSFAPYDGVAASSNSPFGAWTIGVLGYAAGGINQTLCVDIEDCIFPDIAPSAIVSIFGATDAFWWSSGNFTTLGNVAVEGPNGIIAASGNLDTQRSPVFQLLSIAFPEAAITLVNGANNNLAIGYSNAYCTGPTSACNITGIVRPRHVERDECPRGRGVHGDRIYLQVQSKCDPLKQQRGKYGRQSDPHHHGCGRGADGSRRFHHGPTSLLDHAQCVAFAEPLMTDVEEIKKLLVDVNRRLDLLATTETLVAAVIELGQWREDLSTKMHVLSSAVDALRAEWMRRTLNGLAETEPPPRSSPEDVTPPHGHRRPQ